MYTTCDLQRRGIYLQIQEKQTLTGSVNVGDSLKQRVKENKPNCFEKNKEKEKSKWIINPFLIKSL